VETLLPKVPHIFQLALDCPWRIDTRSLGLLRWVISVAIRGPSLQELKRAIEVYPDLLLGRKVSRENPKLRLTSRIGTGREAGFVLLINSQF
jgi:hypothetical protein